MLHLSTAQFDTAIEKGIYTLIEDKGDVKTVKYWHASLREEFNKIQDVKVFDNRQK